LGQAKKGGGKGHFWVIDGVRRMSYTEILADGARWTWSDRNFVRCSVGWSDADDDAWYISGIFDFRTGHQPKFRSTIDYYYQYDIKMLPNVWFK
jgi:hypothetical protein